MKVPLPASGALRNTGIVNKILHALYKDLVVKPIYVARMLVGLEPAGTKPLTMFLVGKKLGAGAEGVVYLVETPDRKVARKQNTDPFKTRR